MPTRISDKVHRWCTATPSVSDSLAVDPTIPPGQAAKKLFNHDGNSAGEQVSTKQNQQQIQPAGAPAPAPSPSTGSALPASDQDAEDLERAFQCGRFGETRPSDLFLKMFHDALLTLEHDPLNGVVSPCLMGSTGVIPLSGIGVVWDICRHMSNLIVRAEKEVFFATNYWSASEATILITDAFKELSKRAGERNEKVVVKVIYDRGNFKQVIKNHQLVPVSEYSGKKLGIPAPEEIPNINLQVVNYHRPAFGTFHSKFMVVDRKYAMVCSNNVMENDNLEMMTHLEGPIVDSLYDVCLISWNIALDLPLPMHKTTAKELEHTTFDDPEFQNLFDENGTLKYSEHIAEPVAQGTLPEQTAEHTGSDAAQEQKTPAANDGSPDPGPLSDENRTSTVQEHLLPHKPNDPHYDSSVVGEFRRMQSSLQPRAGVSHMQLVSDHLNISTKVNHKPTAPEPSSTAEYFMPFIPHPPHKPFPIALVNRKPAGAPNNSSLHVPQNAAWISALRNAKKSVFIQTPDLNAVPLLPEILKAVRRGVEVEYWLCLGYNDAGELLPGQGGTNEMIAAKLFGELKSDGEEVSSRLKVGWYVGKDLERVIHKKEGGRCCHIKLMVVDGHVGIQGNGNQDTQTWFHSQEINIMVDSELICKAWMEGIRRNQNTHLYGMGSTEDGLWRNKDGNEAKEAIGKDPGRFSWAKGIVGAVQRVRGVGGF